MSEEKKKISYSDLPEGIRKLISTAKGRGIIKYFSEHPETLKTAIKASELRRIAAEKVQNDPAIQEKINRIASRIVRDSKIQQDFFKARKAAHQAALSGTYGDFKEYDSIVQNFGNSMGLTPWKSSEQADLNNDAPLAEDLRQEAVNREEILNAVSDKITDIKFKIQEFLDEFKETVQRNETASSENAKASMKISKLAIIISVLGILASGGIQWYFAWRAEKNDKTGELIEVVKKSHPWSEQQISADDAKNVNVAFHAITEALQKNVQLEKDNIQLRQETDRLQADLKKAQDDLAELKKQYNTDKGPWTQEKQKLYSEITALKKQIEELNAELAKISLSSKNSQQEADR